MGVVSYVRRKNRGIFAGVGGTVVYVHVNTLVNTLAVCEVMSPMGKVGSGLPSAGHDTDRFPTALLAWELTPGLPGNGRGKPASHTAQDNPSTVQKVGGDSCGKAPI